MNAHVIVHPVEQKRHARDRLVEAADKLCALLDKILAEMDAIDGDLEDEHDGREPDEADLEPSLGAVEGRVDQRAWARSSTSDLEAQCEDEGFDADREPDPMEDGLYPPFQDDQTLWAQLLAQRAVA